MKPQSPTAPAGETPTAESLGWQLRSALPPMRLNSVSLCDAEADVLWLSEGALGPDEHSVVFEAIAALQADTSLPYYEAGMEDGRLAISLAVRAPKGGLVGVAMILAEMKGVPDGVLERLVTPQVRTILQKIAVFLHTRKPTAAETGATVAMPTPSSMPPTNVTATSQTLSPKIVDEMLTLELVAEAPAPAAAKPAPAAAGKSAAQPAGAAKAKPAPAAPVSPAKGAAAAKGGPAVKTGGSAPSLLNQVLEPSAMAELEFTVETPVSEPPADEITSEVPAVAEEFVMSVGDTGQMEVVPAASAKATSAKAAAAAAPSGDETMIANHAARTQVMPRVAIDQANANAAKLAAASKVVAPAPAPAPRKVADDATMIAPHAARTEIMPGPAPGKATAAKVAAAFEQSADASEPGADLVLHIQELIKLRSNGRTRRYEVLARSRKDAERDEVPAHFVAEAAKGKEGAVLDGFVVQRLLTWLAEHGDVVWDSEPASFSINLSIGAIEDPRFADRVAAALSASQVPAEHIGFEITEFACVQCKPQVQRFVEVCEQLGCFLVLDNFTFDPASLQLLGSSAVRAVKVDPKLTNVAMKDKLSQAIVVAIAQACKVMGVHCVAKRIDSQAALQWLTAVGCDFAQGYALERPLPIDTLLAGPAPKRK